MGKADCYDCGLDYSQFPADFVIQNELWEKISPYGGVAPSGGILCPNCMCKRLVDLGMSAVWVVVNTGEIEIKNSITAKIVNFLLNTKNAYKTWQCERWINKQLPPDDQGEKDGEEKV